MASKKIPWGTPDKEAKMALVKMFRILRVGAAEGERLVNKLGTDETAYEQLLEHIAATKKVLDAAKNALELHPGAASILDRVEKMRGKPPVAAPIGRPRGNLRLIKGGE